MTCLTGFSPDFVLVSMSHFYLQRVFNIKEGAITTTMFANCALQIYLIFISLNISKKNKRHFFFTYPIFANFALLFTNLKDTDKRSKARKSSIPKDRPNR